jgi:hypothetical protein
MFTIFWAVVLRRRDIEFPFWKAATRRARTVGPRRIKTALYRIRENPVSPVFWVAPAGLSIYHESHESLADAAHASNFIRAIDAIVAIRGKKCGCLDGASLGWRR